MNQYYLTLRKSIKVMNHLLSIGYTEIDEKISNHEADEEFMVIISKEKKTFALIDHKNLMKNYNNKNQISLTQLKEIKKWQIK